MTKQFAKSDILVSRYCSSSFLNASLQESFRSVYHQQIKIISLVTLKQQQQQQQTSQPPAWFEVLSFMSVLQMVEEFGQMPYWDL